MYMYMYGKYMCSLTLVESPGLTDQQLVDGCQEHLYNEWSGK